MKIHYLLILIFLSCDSTAQNRSFCFADKGIKKAMIKASLIGNEGQTEFATIHFNKSGLPTLREHSNRKIELVYEGMIMKYTVIYSDEKEMKIDTNFVVKNDELGRPLKITSDDGRYSDYTYKDCEEVVEIYREPNGNFIHNSKSVFKKGVLVENRWFYNDGSEDRVTEYFDYKFDNYGYWIERKYYFTDDELVKETRKLEYY